MAWQDDMFLRTAWLVPELLRTFDSYAVWVCLPGQWLELLPSTSRRALEE